MGIQGVTCRGLPSLYVKFGFSPIEALLDSGAVPCLMSGSVYRTLREESSSAQVSPVQVKCIAAATQSFPVDIAVTCKLRIDRYTWKFRFYVVEDLIYPVILGSDFLGKTGLLVDIREGFSSFRFDPTNKLSLVGRRPASNFPKICLSAENSQDLSHYPNVFRRLLMNFRTT
jgi:hypothetical protein